MTAETIALQGLTNTIFFVKEVLNEICGDRTKNLQSMMLTSNHNLLANIRRINSQVHPNIRNIAERMIQEVRHISPSLNITEGLTRTVETNEKLQRLLRTGWYHVPGGFPVPKILRSSFKQPTNPLPFRVHPEGVQQGEESHDQDQEHRSMTCQRNPATEKETVHFEANEERKPPSLHSGQGKRVRGGGTPLKTQY